MITEWGMSDELGTITFGNNNNDQVFLGRDLGRDRNYSEAVAYSIDKEVKRMMDECHAEARRLLSENLDKLTLIAETLKERETIQADEFMALMEGRSLEELDQQKEALLREQKGIAAPKAERTEAAEPAKLAETAEPAGAANATEVTEATETDRMSADAASAAEATITEPVPDEAQKPAGSAAGQDKDSEQP